MEFEEHLRAGTLQPEKSLPKVWTNRDAEYGLSAARAARRGEIRDFPALFPNSAACGWQKNSFSNCHKNVVFAVDRGERPNLYTHPSARRTALYGVTARL
jgi:hypothetical protein